MYEAPLAAAASEGGGLHAHAAGAGWAQDCSPAAQAALVAGLPAAVLRKLAAATGGAPPAAALPPAARAALGSAVSLLPDRQRVIRGAVASLVRASSHRQAVAGLLSAGVLNSARYAAQKVLKAWRP